MATDNPYRAPRADLSTDFGPRDFGEPIAYGGIGRGVFFGLYFLAIVAAVIVAALVGWDRMQASEDLRGAFRLALTVVLVILATQRARNLGSSPWWGLTILIPLYNIVVFLRCLAYPEGWSDHRTVDSAGRVVSLLVGGLFLLAVGVILWAAFAGA